MRKLTPQRRRAAAICGACGAIIPSSALLMQHRPASSPVQFVGGMLIGTALTISLAAFVSVRRRPACS